MATPAPGDDSGAISDVQRYRRRACQSCARSKMRCVWPSKMGVSPCQRCTKTKTACTLVELKPNKRRRGPSTRVGQLEEKLDGIVSLLNANQSSEQQQHQTQKQHNSYASYSNTQHGIQSFLNPEKMPEPRPRQTITSIVSPLSSVTSNTATSSTHHGHTEPLEYVDIVPGFRMTFGEANVALDLYRSVYTPSFPFVPIPLTMTAFELYQTTPFLLRTILQVTAPQTPTIQREVQLWFRQYIAQHVVVEQERSLELLQCILAFVAWGNFQFYIESQATDLLQLAGAIVIDLGLNKSLDSLGATRGSFVPEAIRKVKGHRRERHTLDDKRAMLGWSYLSSLVATLFRRLQSSVYTPYLTHCCETLLAIQEYNSDKLLVALVGIQRILTRVSDAFPSPDLEDPLNQVLGAPLYMVMATAKKELDALFQNQPSEVKCNGMMTELINLSQPEGYIEDIEDRGENKWLTSGIRTVLFWINYHGVLMKLYEPAIHMRHSQSSKDLFESTYRTETLWNCLHATKLFFASYVTIPLDNLGSISLVATAYMSFAVVTSSRLLFLNDSDWDVNLARKSFDFAAACQGLSDMFREGDRLAQSLGRRRKFEDNGESVLGAHHMKILWIRNWYLDKTFIVLSEAATKASTSVSANTGQVGMAMDSDPQQQSVHDSSLLPIELDEEFWRALLDSNPLTYMPQV